MSYPHSGMRRVSESPYLYSPLLGSNIQAAFDALARLDLTLSMQNSIFILYTLLETLLNTILCYLLLNISNAPFIY